MPTLTTRNVPAGKVDTLKTLAKRQGRSMEQEVLSQIEEDWEAQTRRPTAEEIDRWMEIGRS